MSTRVWVPATTSLLSTWFVARQVPAGHGHAVTAALREGWPDGDDEEWEYAVLMAAADDAAGLLHAPGRRVVVVLDAGAVAELDGTAARFDEPVPWRRLAAVHADPRGTEVAAGVPGALAPQLCWFAVQEVPDLLDRPQA